MQRAVLPLWRDHAPPDTHLDPPETPVEAEPSSPSTVDPDGDNALCDNFRHSGWRHARQAIFHAFQELNLPPARSQAFRLCGSSWWVQRHREDRQRYRIVPDHCHDRFCIPCAHSRQRVIRNNAYRLIRDHEHRFLTLTIRNPGQDLNTLLNRLYTAFRKLRQRSIWRNRVYGGAAFCEVTYNAERDSWNPHLHCILDGRYIDRPDLSRAWLAVTGDSFNVHIRLIRTKHAVCDYVTKYATKPLPHNAVSCPAPLREAILAFRRRRLIVTFGTWRHFKLLDNPADADWEQIDHFNGVSFRAASGDEYCRNILSMMHTADPFSGEFYVTDDRPPIDDSS